MGWGRGALSQSMRPGNQFHCKEQIRNKISYNKSADIIKTIKGKLNM